MGLAAAVANAARQLEKEGVRAITGDCGFMALYQDAVRSAVSVPVCMSSLSQIPFMRTMLPEGRRIGVVTANSESLDDAVLRGAGVDPGRDIVIVGLEECDHFVSAVFREEGSLDTEKVENEVVTAARSLLEKAPDVFFILLECSLLPPYAAAVREATGVPVLDYLTMIRQLHDSVVPKGYRGYM